MVTVQAGYCLHGFPSVFSKNNFFSKSSYLKLKGDSKLTIRCFVIGPTPALSALGQPSYLPARAGGTDSNSTT